MTGRLSEDGRTHEEALLDLMQTPSPFDRLYGLEFLVLRDDLVSGRVPVEPSLTQSFGMVHGGVYAAIAEALASTGTNIGVARDGAIGLGLSNQTSFLRPATGGHLHATAKRRHRGRTTWVWDVDITDDAAKLCATSRMTIAVRPAAAMAGPRRLAVDA